MKKATLLAACILTLALLVSGCANAASLNLPTDAKAPAADDKGTVTCSVAALPLMLKFAEGYGATGAPAPDVSAVGRDEAVAALSSKEANLAIFEGSLSDIPAGSEGEALAYEALAVVINPSAGVKNLTSAQITAIFSGESDDWADFGGTGRLTLVLPEKDDGFRRSFEEFFALRAPVNGILKSIVPDTAKISEDVASDVAATPGAIGLCPLAALEGPGAAVSIDGVSPTPDTLKDGSYQPSRTLVLAKSADAPESLGKFYDWCSSDEAKELSRTAGFLPVE